MQCNAMQCNATHSTRHAQCNAMQCNAMQCNAMQCNAMQCNAMQHTARVTQHNSQSMQLTQKCATIQHTDFNVLLTKWEHKTRRVSVPLSSNQTRWSTFLVTMVSIFEVFAFRIGGCGKKRTDLHCSLRGSRRNSRCSDPHDASERFIQLCMNRSHRIWNVSTIDCVALEMETPREQDQNYDR